MADPSAQVAVSAGSAGCILCLRGSLGIAAAAALHAAALEVLAASGSVTIDCGATDYLDVAALQILLALRQAVTAAGRAFCFATIPVWLERQLALVGLTALAQPSV